MSHKLRCFLLPHLRTAGLVLLALGGATRPAAAQKIADSQAWTTFHKAPKVALAGQYKTYAVAYDFGALPVPVAAPPLLQGLQLQPADADLLLKVTVRDLYLSNRNLLQRVDSKTKETTAYNYELTDEATYGYELIDQRAHRLLARYWVSGSSGGSTPDFKTLPQLNEFVQTNYLPGLAKIYLDRVLQRLGEDLTARDYRLGLTVNTVEGSAPAYAEINQQAAALTALLASPTPDKAQVAPLVAVWEKHLASANWEDKKSEINKNVANALLANLCAAYLLAQDYPRVKQYGWLFAYQNGGGLFGKAWPSFQKEDVTGNPAALNIPPGTKANRATTYKQEYFSFASAMLAR